MQLETEQTVSQLDHLSSLQQGLLFVLSAPSGTGKDTVINALKQQGMDFYVVASVTTRAPRPGESEGNPYHFVNPEKFEQLMAQGELLEHANVHGNWYGQPRQAIRDNLRAGRDVLLKIDVQGAATIRRKVPEAIFIFLVPSSLEELAQRLTNRHTETDAERTRRLTD
ncbi:MAG: guanylate kinase, partial [Ktedonobacteraceae bacterium]